MIISGSQRGSSETIVGQFFMTPNVWMGDPGDPETLGFNLKGLCAFTDVNAIANAPGLSPGLCCTIPTGVDLCSPLGIIVSDVVLGSSGVSAIAGTWVQVQHFGFVERILFDTSEPIDTADVMLFTGSNPGFLSGCTAVEYSQPPTFTGTLDLDTVADATPTIDFAGTNSTGVTWTVPLTYAQPAGVSVGRASLLVGWHYIGDAERELDEVRNGTFSAASALAIASRQTRGFISCMGVAQPWS